MNSFKLKNYNTPSIQPTFINYQTFEELESVIRRNSKYITEYCENLSEFPSLGDWFFKRVHKKFNPEDITVYDLSNSRIDFDIKGFPLSIMWYSPLHGTPDNYEVHFELMTTQMSLRVEELYIPDIPKTTTTLVHNYEYRNFEDRMLSLINGSNNERGI